MSKQGEKNNIRRFFKKVCGEDKKDPVLTITQSDINNVSSLVTNLFDFPTLIEHTFDCGSASGK